jgi:potassium/hydrogen antiporter
MEKIMLLFAIILLISAFSTKISKRLNVPVLVIFLFIGMIFGSEGVGKIYFDNADIAYTIASVALCFILFYGGLATSIREIRPILKEGITLSVLGVLLNAVLFAFPIFFFTKLNMIESFLASACVASTDAAAVFFLLEFNKVNLKHRLRNILELESGSNDPMAYVLVLIFISVINTKSNDVGQYVFFFFRQMAIGLAMGFALGYLTKFVLERLRLKIEELYSIILMGMLFLTFSLTNMLYGNGFLAIYILGIIIRSRKYLFKNSTIKFFSVISWLMQITLFICLGLLVFPSKLFDFMWMGIPLALVLVFIVRPLSVFGTLSFFGKKINKSSKLYISWGGLKGAVPIVFAIFVKTADIPYADTIFNLVFCIVLVSVLIQGTTLSFMAKILKLNSDKKMIIKHKSETEELEYFEDQMLELTIPENSRFADKKIHEFRMPEGALITLIKRDREYIHPTGQTKVHSDDKLIIMCKNKIDFFNYIDSLHKS